MKRSEINRYIAEAMAFMDKNKFYLPEWANWSPEQWKAVQGDCSEIFANALGWDITDFGSEDFRNTGLTLFTVRNGNLKTPSKPYCEKIMYVRENQVTPYHFHFLKTEDIINRAGGLLCMKLYKSTADEQLSEEPVEVKIDGILRTVKAGEVLKLKPGQSICYTPYLYHSFWAEEGDCLVGEVSTVNDDHNDNRFVVQRNRFSQIQEDEPVKWYLCNEYPQGM